MRIWNVEYDAEMSERVSSVVRTPHFNRQTTRFAFAESKWVSVCAMHRWEWMSESHICEKQLSRSSLNRTRPRRKNRKADRIFGTIWSWIRSKFACTDRTDRRQNFYFRDQVEMSTFRRVVCNVHFPSIQRIVSGFEMNKFWKVKNTVWNIRIDKKRWGNSWNLPIWCRIWFEKNGIWQFELGNALILSSNWFWVQFHFIFSWFVLSARLSVARYSLYTLFLFRKYSIQFKFHWYNSNFERNKSSIQSKVTWRNI